MSINSPQNFFSQILSHLKRRQSSDSDLQPGPSKKICTIDLTELLSTSSEQEATNSTSNNGATSRNSPPSKFQTLSHATKTTLNSFSADNLTEEKLDFETIRERCGKYANTLAEDMEVQSMTDEELHDEDEKMKGTNKGNNSISRFEKSSSKPPNSLSDKKIKIKYTPLELQVVELKEKYPDALLFIECGYKYRFFGEDAEVMLFCVF